VPRVLLISTYELGHQPLHVASPAAALTRRGHDVRCLDLGVDDWDGALASWADAVAVSVPMHTAMRLGLRAATAVRDTRPDTPICLYGLYAPVSRDTTVGRVADRVIAGEYEPALVAWVDEVTGAAHPAPDDDGATTQVVHLGRGGFQLPARHLLPSLDRYARLSHAGTERVVGYTEASHGCVFRCRHCPVPTVYDGRTRIVSGDVVAGDIDQLVAAGAEHITFGDPDFLGGAQHALRVVRALHQRHPGITFDVTTKVELVLRHRPIWAELAEAGCLFVVSAVETLDDAILDRLDKGHTAADAAEAVEVLRAHGIELRPSLMPFTPWTTLDGLVELVDFVAEHDLVGNVDPVHYTIRLLLPEGSLLTDHPDLAPHLDRYDPEMLGWRWSAADPRVDRLQQELAALVEDHVARGEPIATTYLAVRQAVRRAAGLPTGDDDPGLAAARRAAARGADRPRLTEPWFCCAEPTEGQLAPLAQATPVGDGCGD
jgi:radical SAM superfamily enzyme YgiQ (UPF0313 family)